MRLSRYLLPTLREIPGDAEVISHRLMLRAGMIKKTAAGIFTYLPLGYRVIKKVENIIREEMDRSGGIEILMPMLQPAELWQESGRWDEMGEELARLKDRNNRQFCLGPTHEEVITDIARHFIRSYKQLPVNLYQIQTKFRDETRPRFGLMRGREFLMKDAYSFHASKDDALREYEVMYCTYERIFTRCGFEFRAVSADTGKMGGAASHEFQVLAKSGEDEILSCADCPFSANATFVQKKEGDLCPSCHKGKLKSSRGIEVGHIFFLGKKYSEALGATFLDPNGKQLHFEMGCYGIGVGRTMAAAIEQHHDESGILWPIPLAPFEVAVIPLNMSDPEVVKVSEEVYQRLLEKNVEALFHDKEESAGVKFNDIDLIGIPIRVVVGQKGISKKSVGIKLRSEKEEKMIAIPAAVDQILKIRDELFRKINHRA
jgi:prolyl-tRNA synthetase